MLSPIVAQKGMVVKMKANRTLALAANTAVTLLAVITADVWLCLVAICQGSLLLVEIVKELRRQKS